MQQKLLHRAEGQRIYAVVLETGDEVMRCLGGFAAAEKISAAQLTAVGALRDVVLMYFDWEKRLFAHSPGRTGGGRLACRRRCRGTGRKTFTPCPSCCRQARRYGHGRASCRSPRAADARSDQFRLAADSSGGVNRRRPQSREATTSALFGRFAKRNSAIIALLKAGRSSGLREDN